MGRNSRSNRPEHEEEPPSGRRARIPRIIVADDDNKMRCRVTSALSADGYMVLEASNGFDVLDHISTLLLEGGAANKPDGIVMALWMRGVSALSILAGLRDSDWRIPIVLLADHVGQESGLRYRRLGARAIFEKPFDVDDLRTVMLNLVPGAIRRCGRHTTLPAFTEEAFAQAS